MRQLHVDREDDPAPGIRILKPQDHSAKPDLSYTLEPEKAPRMLVYGKKCLQNTMRLDDPIRTAAFQHLLIDGIPTAQNPIIADMLTVAKDGSWQAPRPLILPQSRVV